MTESKITSWIFLATALASQKESADLDSISMVADGINHLIPTEKELRKSLTWLIAEGLILKHEKKYMLTSLGMIKYEQATKTTRVLFKIWDNLDKELMRSN